MARTALQLINASFRKAGILSVGDTLTASEANDALESLNELMESLSNEGLMITSRVLESFSLSSGVTDYTIGPSATFNTSRPVKVVSAYVRQGEIDYDVQLITDEIYAGITFKQSGGGLPYFLNYTNAYPQATIRLYPEPGAGYALFLLSEKPLTTFTLNQTISLPPGWNRYLINALALEIQSEYGQSIPQETVEALKEGKAAIMLANAKAKTMDAMPLAGANRNIYTGWTN